MIPCMGLSSARASLSDLVGASLLFAIAKASPISKAQTHVDQEKIEGNWRE